MNDATIEPLAKKIAEAVRNYTIGKDGSFYAIEGVIERVLRADAGKMFPLQAALLRSDPVKTGPRRIPWAIAEEAYAEYSRRYGMSQSLERLAERGGFGWGEMDEFLPGWRDRVGIVVELNAHIIQLEIARGEMAEGVLEIAKAIGMSEDEFETVIDFAGKVNAELDRLKDLARTAQADAGLARDERDRWKRAAEADHARAARLDDELEKWPDDVGEALGDDYHGRDGEDVLTATRRIVSGLRARVAELEEFKLTPDEVNALPEGIRKYVHDLATRCDPAGEVAELMLTKDENRMLRARVVELEEATVEIVIPPSATKPCPDCNGTGETVLIDSGQTGPVSLFSRSVSCETCDGLGVVAADPPGATRTCPACNGNRNNDDDETCGTCDGFGFVDVAGRPAPDNFNGNGKSPSPPEAPR